MIVPLAPSTILLVCSSRTRSVVVLCLAEDEERGAETGSTVKVGGTDVEGAITVADGTELGRFSDTMLDPTSGTVGVSGGTLILGLNCTS